LILQGEGEDQSVLHHGWVNRLVATLGRNHEPALVVRVAKADDLCFRAAKQR
jgi:hypothetical protein